MKKALILTITFFLIGLISNSKWAWQHTLTRDYPVSFVILPQDSTNSSEDNDLRCDLSCEIVD